MVGNGYLRLVLRVLLRWAQTRRKGGEGHRQACGEGTLAESQDSEMGGCRRSERVKRTIVEYGLSRRTEERAIRDKQRNAFGGQRYYIPLESGFFFFFFSFYSQ